MSGNHAEYALCFLVLDTQICHTSKCGNSSSDSDVFEVGNRHWSWLDHDPQMPDLITLGESSILPSGDLTQRWKMTTAVNHLITENVPCFFSDIQSHPMTHASDIRQCPTLFPIKLLVDSLG